jgi:UDP-N-acetylglucosamine:LPS N-acetylglucosamine transferase
LTVARSLDTCGVDLQAIFLCGHDQAAAEALRRLPTRYPRAVVDFTPRVGYFMALSDVFIGKPGPGSITEALVKGLPLVLRCGRVMLPTERPNGGWVRRHGFGVTIRSYRKLGPALRQLLDPPTLAAFRRNVEAFEGRGVFEVPEILGTILARTSHQVKG